MRILILVLSLIIVGSGYSQRAEHYLPNVNLNDKKLSQTKYNASTIHSSLDHSSSKLNPAKVFYDETKQLGAEIMPTSFEDVFLENSADLGP